MKTKAFISGHFNVLHPGHLRLFQFAKSLADVLVVGVESDRLGGAAVYIPEALRCEGLCNCTIVDEVILFDEPVSNLITRLRPEYVIKGREHERVYNPELSAVQSYGGQLLFNSGEVQFSTNYLVRSELMSEPSVLLAPPTAYMDRHGITSNQLFDLVSKFSALKILIVGDLIVDQYIDCEPLGMSQEDPTLVVSPIERKQFIGGAGIVAAHAAGLGAQATLISVTGSDETSQFAESQLTKLGVKAFLLRDESRPTTRKERYRSQEKTLLRVSHLHQSSVSLTLQEEILEKASHHLPDSDILIFSDFNYGVLPQAVIDRLIALAKKCGVVIAADSQSSSQIGDVGRFKEVDLLMPTEREARMSLQNREDGLVIIAELLREKSLANAIILKLGRDGAIIHAPEDDAKGWITDKIDALNKFPKDVAGAGDSMLVASAMTIAVGGDVWAAASLGSLAAGIQVGRVGNTPLQMDELRTILSRTSSGSPS